MMQPQLLHQPSWPSSYNVDYSTLPRTRLCGLHEDSYVRDNYTHSSLLTTTDSFGVSSVSDFSALFPDAFTELSSLQLQNDMQILPPLPDGEFEDVCKWLNISDSEDGISSEASFSIAQSSDANRLPAIFPGSGVEVDTQLSLHHLLGAYAEAMENGHEELAEVIVKRIRGKASPLGETLERVAHSLFEEDQEGYLRQESSNNFEQAFRAFYQILPFGRFAHFAANSAILEALPNDAETVVHIIDFDMGEGVQWPPVIEAMARKRRALNLRLTSIKPNHESTSNQYEGTKRRLYDHAKPFALNLQIEEMSVEELAIETKRMNNKGPGKQWLAFNCMFRLPHNMATNMPKTTQAMEFLKIAKQLLAHSETQTGIIIFAHGESEGCNTPTSNYTSFFNNKLVHYKSLLESIEWHFPAILSEARIALESIFLAPCINSESWYQDWEQNKIRGTCDFQLQRQTLSTENLVQAKELVGERESPYRVRIEEHKQNEMILEWRGTPLIRVSTWM